MMNDYNIAMSDNPSEPGWAGTFTDEYWWFVRDGLWCIKDAETGAHKGALYLAPPEALQP